MNPLWVQGGGGRDVTGSHVRAWLLHAQVTPYTHAAICSEGVKLKRYENKEAIYNPASRGRIRVVEEGILLYRCGLSGCPVLLYTQKRATVVVFAIVQLELH